MDRVAKTLVQRGLDAHANFRAASANDEYNIEVPAWGLAVLVVTVIGYVYCATIIDYTYGCIVATLATIESPTAVLFETVASEDPDMPLHGKKSEFEPEMLLMKKAPITSSLRKTRLHLRQQSGFFSQFRGYGIYIIHNYLYFQVKVLCNSMLPPMFGLARVVTGILTAVALASIHMLWTHIVISQSSRKPLLKRFGSRRQWMQVARPAVLVALSHELVGGVVVLLLASTSLLSLQEKPAFWLLCLEALAIVTVGLVATVSLIFPAKVILTRVEASLLPVDDETVVPFDRSFGGRALPAVVNGSAPISMLDSWKSFDWNARIRLAKVYLKVFAIQIALLAFVMIALTTETKLILGNDFSRAVERVRSQPPVINV